MMKKINRSLMKSYLKYFTITLAMILLIIQVITIFTEDEKLQNKNLNTNIFDNSTRAEFCERKNKAKYAEYLAKCFMAFFSGCLLSEMRFLRTGIIWDFYGKKNPWKIRILNETRKNWNSQSRYKSTSNEYPRKKK